MTRTAEEIADSLSEAHFDFLDRVYAGRPLGCADRQDDKVRQKCRKLGLVHVVKNPRRWEMIRLGYEVRSILESRNA